MTRHKPFLLITSIATVVAAAIFIFMLTSKQATYNTMQIQIDTILRKMECPNNECDRYKGVDAARDLAAVYKRIDEVEKACNLQNTSKDK